MACRYVKLISSDGHEFIVKREHALTSGTIKAMLSGPGQFAENETNEVNFREIPSHVLQKVCMYFTYKVGLGAVASKLISDDTIAGEIHQQLYGNPGVPNSSRDCSGASDGG